MSGGCLKLDEIIKNENFILNYGIFLTIKKNLK